MQGINFKKNHHGIANFFKKRIFTILQSFCPNNLSFLSVSNQHLNSLGMALAPVKWTNDVFQNKQTFHELCLKINKL